MSLRTFVNKYHEGLSISIISILYTVGLVRIIFMNDQEIIVRTPLLLLINFLFLYIYTYENRKQKLLSFSIVFLLGLVIEIIGVNTGFPFGEYQYGEVLGSKVLGTPWIIGINWVIVVVGAFQFITRILPLSALFIRAVGTAFVTIALDLLMEPVAIEFNMWSWDSSNIPSSNYVAWWIITLILSYLYGRMTEQRTHLVVIIILMWLFIFFGVLNLSL